MCEALYKHLETTWTIEIWSISVAKHVLCKEVENLTHEKHGLHFKAKSSTAEQQEGFMMNEVANTMRGGGPYLWELVTALLDSIPNHRRAEKASVAEPALFMGQEMDLGEFGGDNIGLEGGNDSDAGECGDAGTQGSDSALHQKK